MGGGSVDDSAEVSIASGDLVDSADDPEDDFDDRRLPSNAAGDKTLLEQVIMQSVWIDENRAGWAPHGLPLCQAALKLFSLETGANTTRRHVAIPLVARLMGVSGVMDVGLLQSRSSETR